MANEQNASQYIFQEGKWIKVGKTKMVTGGGPEPTPSGSSENKKITTRFSARQLVGNGTKTLSQIVFTNTTGKTLYIVGDVSMSPSRNKGKKSFKRHLISSKGEYISHWDLKRRRKVYSQFCQEIAPGEEVPLWKVLGFNFNYFDDYDIGITPDSQLSYVTNTDHCSDMSEVEQCTKYKYIVGVPALDKSWCSDDDEKMRKFDEMFGTRHKGKCIYIIDRGEFENNGKPQYYTKEVYLALNVLYSTHMYPNSYPHSSADKGHKVGLIIQFLDINMIDGYIRRRSAYHGYGHNDRRYMWYCMETKLEAHKE